MFSIILNYIYNEHTLLLFISGILSLLFITLTIIYNDYKNNHNNELENDKSTYQDIIDHIQNIDTFKKNTDLFNFSTYLYQKIFPEDIDLSNQLYILIIIISFTYKININDDVKNKIINIINKCKFYGVYVSIDNIIKCHNNNYNFIDTTNKSLYMLANDIVNDSYIVLSLDNFENNKQDDMKHNKKNIEYYNDQIKNLMTSHGLSIYVKCLKQFKKNHCL